MSPNSYFTIGKLYTSNTYFYVVYPDKKYAYLGPSLLTDGDDELLAGRSDFVLQEAEFAARFLTTKMDFMCDVDYLEPGTVFMVLDKSGWPNDNLLKILTPKSSYGWIKLQKYSDEEIDEVVS